MPLKCIPLRPEWTGSTGPDIRAIYRRKKTDNWGNPVLDAEGREQWDTTGGLPLRRHSDWLNKGYEYITLADEDSLAKVAKWLRADGEDPMAYIQDRRTRSPFNPDIWYADQQSAEANRIIELRELVAEYGVDAVVRMRGPLPAVLLKELAAVPETVEPPKRGPGRPKREATEAA